MPLGDRTDIGQVFNQISYSKFISKAILATSIDKSDDKLATWSKDNEIECFRGNLDDVLDRYYQAAKLHEPDIVVRITGDCPLIDPEIVDKVIALFLNNNFDYVSNVNPPTFPDGLDTEVFTFKALEESWNNAKLNSDREHVTPYIRNNSHIYNIGNLVNEVDLSKQRWTLDNKEDYLFLTKVYDLLGKDKSYIKYTEVLSLLDENPGFRKINSHLKRNEGYIKSILNDEL